MDLFRLVVIFRSNIPIPTPAPNWGGLVDCTGDPVDGYGGQKFGVSLVGETHNRETNT